MPSFNIKARRIQTISNKFKTYDDYSYKKINTRCEANKNTRKTNIKTVNDDCCVNYISMTGVKWETWKNKLYLGKALAAGNGISCTDVSTTYNNVIKAVEIYNHVAPININRVDCSGAFIGNSTTCPSGSSINIIITLETKTCINPFTCAEIKFNKGVIDIGSGVSNSDCIIELKKVIKNNKTNIIKRNINPIAGYRKTLCVNKPHVREIYKDPHSQSYIKNQGGGCVSYNNVIRSGMQPINNKFNCDTGCCKDKYNFSYNEVNKKRFIKCGCGDNKCGKNKTNIIWKPNNDKFKVQGAVSSSSRLERLKLETLMVDKKRCKTTKT